MKKILGIFKSPVFLALIAVLLVGVFAYVHATPTVTITKSFKNGNLRERIGTFKFDSSYPTGGESFTAADMNLNGAYHVDLSSRGRNPYHFYYDSVNSKIKAFRSYSSGGGAELTNGFAALSSTTINFRAIGY